MPLLLLVIVGLWFWLGDPPKDVANAMYSETNAPWESVDAYYYPDRANLRQERSMKGLANVQACREWAYYMAATMNDPNMQRGAYECGIGEIEEWMGMTIYRITTE